MESDSIRGWLVISSTALFFGDPTQYFAFYRAQSSQDQRHTDPLCAKTSPALLDITEFIPSREDNSPLLVGRPCIHSKLNNNGKLNFCADSRSSSTTYTSLLLLQPNSKSTNTPKDTETCLAAPQRVSTSINLPSR